MGLKRWLKQLVAGGAPTAMQLVVASASDRRTDSTAVMGKYKGWVYVCANGNAGTCASVPLRLYARGQLSTSARRWYGAEPVRPRVKHHIEWKQRQAIGEITELTEHPVLDLLRLANPNEIGFNLKEKTFLHQELVGNAYWYLEPYTDPARAGQPEHIWTLLPHLVTVVPNPKGDGIKGYLYGRNPATQIAYKADEIIHFRYPNPNSNIHGLGPAQAMIMAINRNEAMASYKEAMYDNHCRPDFLITGVPEGTGEDEVKRLYEQWERRFNVRGGKFKKAAKPWIATEGMGITPLTFPPKDMQDVPQAKLDRDEIFQGFGRPLTMGEISTSRAGAETGEYAYMVHTIQPRLRRFEQFLNEYLAPRGRI